MVKLKSFLLIFTLMFVLGACYSEESIVETSKEEVIEVETPIEKEEPIFEEEDEENEDNEEDNELQRKLDKISTVFVQPTLGTRPLAVVIDNVGERTLPQGGLYKAQVIYEMIVEGGLTRIMPVFWGMDIERIGPVRSTRHYFLDYAMEHDAVHVHFGWSPQAKDDIAGFNLASINGVGFGGSVFWKLTNDPTNWQDSYTSTARINNFISRTNFRRQSEKEYVFKYASEDTILQGEKEARNVNIVYSVHYNSGFKYDEDLNLYLRYRMGVPHMERETGKQLAAKNIIIQFVQNGLIKGDTEGRQELYNIGSGKGWYISNGEAMEITWQKSSRNQRTRYLDSNNNEIVLNPGQTWVQIVPNSRNVTIN